MIPGLREAIQYAKELEIRENSQPSQNCQKDVNKLFTDPVSYGIRENE
jgi:hypothetical protein